MRDQIKNYLTDKRIFRRIVIVVAFLVIVLLQVSGGKRRVHLNLNTKLSFAGEMMPSNGRYELNNERFDREVALLEVNEAQFVMIYKRWNLIIPMIERELKKAGLPDDFKYIPVIESALRDNVVSSAGAAGLRQLMPGTAQKYGLIVNEFIDERYDVAKSTAAAISHLKEVGKQFNKRTLVAAAYNRGENGLQRSLESQFTNNFYDLWLNNETARYVFRILAMKYVREHKYSFFNEDILGDMYSPIVTKSMSVKQIDDLADRARKNNLGYYEVKKLNPRIRANSLPEGKWTLSVITND